MTNDERKCRAGTGEWRTTNRLSPLATRHSPLFGHTLVELIVAMVASTFLLAGLWSVMFVARQIAYTPSAAIRRTQSAEAVNRLADELRYATLILQQSPNVLEFLVADRDADGAAEKIRYEWSGTPGDPLYKTMNGGASAAILKNVNSFELTYLTKAKSTAYTTTNQSAEAVLQSNATVQSGSERLINTASYSAQQVIPTAFASIPAGAISWTATKVDFQCRSAPATTDTLLLQLRQAGDPYEGPTSHVLGQQSVAESSLSSSTGWNTVTFATPIRDLLLHRRYVLTWTGLGSGTAARLLYNDNASTGVLESDDAGATWSFMTSRKLFYRLYGTYTTPGATYNVSRNYVTDVQIALRAGDKTHARIDAKVPLANTPELLSAFWRTDFDANPTAANANGDTVSDWALASGSFNPATLIGGVWYASGALETRPPHDFTNVTTVSVRCRNTTVGGNGAVVRINADRSGGQYAPLLVYVQKQSDGSQTLTLSGKSSDANTTKLFTRQQLSSDLVRYQLTVLPQNNVVNLTINGEDQGTFSYPTYTPVSTNDRFLTLFADTSQAEFDYVETRVGTN